MLHKNRP